MVCRRVVDRSGSPLDHWSKAGYFEHVLSAVYTDVVEEKKSTKFSILAMNRSVADCVRDCCSQINRLRDWLLDLERSFDGKITEVSLDRYSKSGVGKEDRL